jgi:hypothetical protein
MKKVAFVEDEECWDIAESMIEEIESIKVKKIDKRSRYARLKGGFKRMLMSRVKLAKAKKTTGQ